MYNVFSEARDLNFGLCLFLHSFYVCASCEGSDEVAPFEPSLVAYLISIKIFCAGSFIYKHILFGSQALKVDEI